MSAYGLSVLPSLSSGASSGTASYSSRSAPASPLFAPTARLSPVPSLLDDDDEQVGHRFGERRASSSSDEDNGASSRKARTSPDFSSMVPHASSPTSPKRAPGLATPPRYGHSSSSAGSVPTLASLHLSSAIADEEDDDVAPVASLPMHLPRPKTKADRDRERALGLVKNPGQKREGLGVKLARKRANSLKWAKYANVGAFEVELGLSNDDLKRN
ncbi:hypothetical protein JCM10450v2_008174 [Rhodotorula kratochvilovae]